MSCFSQSKHLDGCARAAYFDPFNLISSFSHEKHFDGPDKYCFSDDNCFSQSKHFVGCALITPTNGSIQIPDKTENIQTKNNNDNSNNM